MKKIRKGACLFLVICFVLGFGFSQVRAEDGQLMKTSGRKHYEFGSVAVNMSLREGDVAPGSKISLRAVVTNQNPYPIVDGSIYLKIYKKRGLQADESKNFFEEIPDQESLSNGDLLIDQFFAREGISLPASGMKEVSVDYDMPENMELGEYKIVSFFQSAKKFNLSGLTFLDDIPGNIFPFTIANDKTKGSVSWDRDHVKLNGEAFDFIGFSQVYKEGDEVKIEAPLKNSTDESQTVNISWDLFYWDGLLESNRISSEKETVSLNPGEVKTVFHSVPGNKYPVNFLVAKADWKDAHSIIDIRFLRDAKEEARNNFMGLSNFPLEKGNPVTVFATAHAVKQASLYFENEDVEKPLPSDYRLNFSLKDRNGEELGNWQYLGPIDGQIDGYEAQFTPDRSYSYLTLESTVKDKDGKVLDSSSLVYDCNLISSSSCLAEDSEMAAASSSYTDSINKTYGAVGLSFIAVIVLIIVFYMIRRKKEDIYVLAFMIVSAALLFSGLKAEAAGDVVFQPNVLEQSLSQVARENGDGGGSQTVVPRTSFQDVILRGWLGDRAYQNDLSGFGPYWTTVNSVQASVTYSAKSSVPDGQAELEVGDAFFVHDLTHHNANSIWWLITGYNIDSPPGCWTKDPEETPARCFYNIYKGDHRRLTSAIGFKPPVISVETSGPVKCTLADANRWKCVTTGAGNIGIQLVYGATQGQFRYVSSDNRNPGGTIKGEYVSKLKCSDSVGGIVEEIGTCSDVVFHQYGYAFKGQCSICGSSRLILPQVSSIKWVYSVTTPVETKKLNVRKVGGATGIISSDLHPELNCPVGCPSSQGIYAEGTKIGDLTATVDGNYAVFNGWTGCDSVSGSKNEVCHVNMNSENRTVKARFDPNPCHVSPCPPADQICRGNSCDDQCGTIVEGTKDCSGGDGGWKEVSPR